MKNDYQNNIKLISHLKNGDKKAYLFLVNSYNHKLCVYANSLVNDHALAEDIVQNVFLKVWVRRKKLRDVFSINNFLYKSVYNEFIDQYRKRQSVMILEKKFIETLSNLTEEKNEDIFQKLIKSVMIAVHNLPPKCKQIFLLSKKEGLTNIEIAEYLNVSIKSVEGHITKAYSKIRKMI